MAAESQNLKNDVTCVTPFLRLRLGFRCTFCSLQIWRQLPNEVLKKITLGFCVGSKWKIKSSGSREWLNDSINQSTQSQGGAFHQQCRPRCWMMIHQPNLQPQGKEIALHSSQWISPHSNILTHNDPIHLKMAPCTWNQKCSLSAELRHQIDQTWRVARCWGGSFSLNKPASLNASSSSSSFHVITKLNLLPGQRRSKFSAKNLP